MKDCALLLALCSVLLSPCSSAVGQTKRIVRIGYLTNDTILAIANERLTRNRAGQVVLQLKSAFKDGTTHIVMSPLEFMQRLAALVPRPRLHLIRFHGVLAPNAKLRREIIPSPPEQATEPACDHAHTQGAPGRLVGPDCSNGSSTSISTTARTAAAA